MDIKATIKITLECSKCHKEFVALRTRTTDNKLLYLSNNGWVRKASNACTNCHPTNEDQDAAT